MKTKVCKSCESVVTHQKSITPGSFIIEVFLWLLFLIPGLIYSLWRVSTRYKGCPHCGSRDLIPADSAAGQRILAAQAKPQTLQPQP
jgi:hypothetical protein